MVPEERLFHRKVFHIEDATSVDPLKVIQRRRVVVIFYDDHVDLVVGDGKTTIFELPSLVRREFPSLDGAIQSVNQLQTEVNDFLNYLSDNNIVDDLVAVEGGTYTIVNETYTDAVDDTNQEFDLSVDGVESTESIGGILNSLVTRINVVKQQYLSVKTNNDNYSTVLTNRINSLTSVIENIENDVANAETYVSTIQGNLNQSIISHVNSVRAQVEFLENAVSSTGQMESILDDLTLSINAANGNFQIHSDSFTKELNDKDSDLDDKNLRITDGLARLSNVESQVDNEIQIADLTINNSVGPAIGGYNQIVSSIEDDVAEIKSETSEILNAYKYLRSNGRFGLFKSSSPQFSDEEANPFSHHIIFGDVTSRKLYTRKSKGGDIVEVGSFKLRIRLPEDFPDLDRVQVFADESVPVSVFNITEFTESSVTLRWDKPDLIDDERNITYSIIRNGEIIIGGLTDTEFIDLNLEEDTEYSYFVIAEDEYRFKTVKQSQARTVVTLSTVPGVETFDRQPISSFANQINPDGSITLEWDDVERYGQVGILYTVERRDVTNNTDYTVVYNGALTTFRDEDVIPDVEYEYSIFAESTS